MKRLWPWIALGVVVVVMLVVLVVRSGPDNSPAARRDRLEHQLACPVCEGQSVADSNALESRAIRAQIPQKIAAGESDQQIKDDFVAAYGQKVLLTPTSGGIGLVAWFVPTIALLLGLAGIAWALYRWSRTPRMAASADDEAVVAAARAAEPEPDA